MSMIIRLTLNLDMSMIGTFNRVSPQFRELTGRHLPSIYIRPLLSEHLDLSQNHDTDISVMKVYKAAGRNSGLAQRIKELFAKNKKWMKAWMTLKCFTLGHYRVKDLFWK